MTMKNAAGTILTKAQLLALTTSDTIPPRVTFTENVYQATGFPNDRDFGSTTILKYAKGQSVLASEIDDLYDSGATAASIDPATGDAAGGDDVVITGTNLGGTSGVTFGGQAATNVRVSADETKLYCTTPAHAAGAVSVVISGEDAAALTKTTFFTYA